MSSSGAKTFVADIEPLLRNLPGWDIEGVRFDESKACLRGTRAQLLDDIILWVDTPDTNRILWLSGGAGTGKSSVAHSCASYFDRQQRLGASFFFNRDIAALNSPKHFIANLCYQLAHFDYHGHIRREVVHKIQSMGHCAASSVRSQARKLIVETMMAAKLAGPVVLVVDAVDEAGTKEMRQPLLDAIAEEFPHLPNSVKIIITSRDEQDIRTSLEVCSDEMCIEEARNTTEDIASYIRHRLTALRPRSHSGGWPNAEKLQALYLRAGHLFVWASVACNFIGNGRDHARRLNQLLDMTSGQSGPTSSPLSKLTSLYDRILETAFPTEEGCLADFHYVVGSIIVLETPLPWIELDSLLGLGNECEEHGLVPSDGEIIYLSSSTVIIDRLRSVLREGSADHEGKDGPIRLLHPSLYDFFTTHAQSDFRIDVIRQHQVLAIRCLHVMNSQLKFDICEIGNASLPNKEFSEACGYMSPGLRYAVFSFVHHISKVSDPNLMLVNALGEFICEHILHWIEAMSLLKAVTKAEECLQTLAEWTKVSFDCHPRGHID